MTNYLSPKNAAMELGVSTATLRKWALNGQIQYIQTERGHHRYDVQSFIQSARPPAKSDTPNSSKKNRDRRPLFKADEYAPLRPDYFRRDHNIILQNFERSILDLERVPLNKLRNFARTIPARRAIHKICNGVLAMEWSISVKDETTDKNANKELIKKIKNSFNRPNGEETKSYSALLKVLVTDILICGFGVLERQLGDYEGESKRVFRLWPMNAANIRINPEWSYQNRKDTYRYYDTGGRNEPEEWRGLLDQDVIIIQQDYCSWAQIPTSTFEVAYNFIEMWLGISDQQRRTTAKGMRRTILSLGEISKPELTAFRQYWKSEIQGTGELPIISGNLSTVDLGAKNDEELYLKYVDYLIRIIALAFDMTNRDFNLTDHDNRATAGVAADSTFIDCILPFALLFEETWNLEILEFYDQFSEFIFEIFDKEPRNEMEEGTLACMFWEKGVAKLNETRLRVGLEPLPEGGDIFFGGKTADQLKAPDQLPMMPGQSPFDPSMPQLPGQPQPKKLPSGENPQLPEVEKPKVSTSKEE